MKHFLRICTACAAVAAASTLPAVEVILDGCRSTAGWNSFNGSEFKGAKVSLSGGADGLKLGYDFAGGGQYVGCHPKKLAVPQADSLSVTVNASSPVGFNYRLIDSTGRTFQGKGFTLRQGVDEKLTLSTTGPWSTAWGGSGNHNRPEFPLKSVWLMATKGKDQPPAGTVTIKSVTAEVPELPENAVSGTGFERDLAGWTLKGEWMPQLEGAMLKITPVSAGDRPAQLEIVFPQPGRDLARRYRLTPGNTNPVYYKVPFPAEVNPRNRYRITLKVADDNGARAEFVTTLSGKLAGTVNLGDPRSSREIKKSKFGTCVHFSYAPKPEGAFKGWYPKELLLDEISNCGFKFIREGLAMDKLPDGSWKIRDVDLETLKKAKERGIEQIVVIGMSAKETIPEFLNKVRAMVEQSRDYVNIYELGNEPNNFGQWRQTFRHKGKDGSWNGYESDGTVSEWVRKHVEYTNAGADLIKKIAPDKTVIGLGSNTPTNFHALNLGVSPQLDGVVDHPYTYSLPSEKVPFGWNLAERDGIRVGDAENTFAGLIGSYREQFRKTGKMRTVWITEFGFTGFWFDGKNETGLYAGFTEEAQAVYLVRRFIEGLALPVAVSCQYDFLDDYGSGEHDAESNFGLLRADYSRKPAFYAVRRMNMLLHNAQPDPAAKVKVTAAPLHRSAQRGELIRDWDKQSIAAENGVRAYAFSDPAAPRERMLAVWSMQPYGREFNNRAVTLEIGGWERFAGLPAAVDLITGDSFGIPFEVKDGRLRIEDLPLKEHPLLITFRE